MKNLRKWLAARLLVPIHSNNELRSKFISIPNIE